MSNNVERKSKSNQIDSRISDQLGEAVRTGTFTFMQEYEKH